MTAISFFSYKGGVGRTLALTSFAMRLAEFGKSVFIIDFDLEAPGVRFKLNKNLIPDEIKSGLVDYIYEFSANDNLDDLDKYVMPLRKNNPSDAEMWLLPAGDTNLDEYWRKLSRINWHDMFYVKGGMGLRFFLDMKEKIGEQYNPDFILIDSRTGITELSGISLKILADEVVVLFINNEENIQGTEKVLSFIHGGADSDKTSIPKVHLILTRIPQHKNSPRLINTENTVLSDLKKGFAPLMHNEPELYVIHTDERLQMNEKVAFTGKRKSENKSADIYSEHFRLFEKIFKDKFTPSEWEKNENSIRAEELFESIDKISNTWQKIKMLTEAIGYNKNKWEYFEKRGQVYESLYLFQEAINDFKMAYEFSLNPSLLRDVCRGCIRLKDYAEALNWANKALEMEQNEYGIFLKAVALQYMGDYSASLQILNSGIERYSKSNQLFNSRANLFRTIKQHEDALKDVYKAIEVSPNDIYYATLAEIYADMGKDDEFYLNLNIALSNGLALVDIRTAQDVYARYRNKKRFIELLRSYNIDSEDIFHNGPPKNLNPNISSDDFDADDDDLVPQSPPIFHD